MNAWICACQTTDRDLEGVSNAWICACQTTDRDLETKKCLDTCTSNIMPFFIYNCNDCNACNACNFYADVLFSI